MPVSTQATSLLPLLPSSTHQTKTIDFGADGLSASLSTSGRIVALFGTHPAHGQILVAPWAQFPSERYHDIPYVRQYRALPYVAHDDPTAGFGLSLLPSKPLCSSSWSYKNGSWPHATQSSANLAITSDWIVNNGCIAHCITATNTSTTAEDLALQLSGPFSVHRASYSQLTPQGDLSIPLVSNELNVIDGSLVVYNKHLPAWFTATLFINGCQHPLSCAPDSSPVTVEYSTSIPQRLAPSSTATFTVVYQLSSQPRLAPALNGFFHAPPSTEGLDVKRLTAYLGGGERGQTLAFIVLRNVDYLLSCCTIPVVQEGLSRGSCIITDHQCLPLGWNRDNYWQLDLLGSLHDCLPSVASEAALPHIRSRLQDCMREHLVWVFETAQRPVGYWARCFYLWGQPKDTVFQLDQQLYPLLELCEFAQRFGSNPTELDFVRRLARGNVDRALACLQEHRCERSQDRPQPWLFKTDETPADDAVEYPYHFSSHVLLWRTLDRLAALQALLADDTIATPTAAWAAAVHEETLRQFTAVNPATNKRMFSYLTSSTGDFQFYHDANDLPTALAPAWGFCGRGSEVWINTIGFAFSTDNVHGFYPGGSYGGLGSVHTRDPWPLGDGQHLAIMSIEAASPEARHATLDKIAREVQWDGLFSEAVNRHSGKVTSKHWFSWPGAFISSTLLRQREGIFAGLQL